MKAFLLAAGLGTRLKPFTDHHPKALAVVNGMTLLERNIKKLQSFGINEFIINVHHFADQIEEYLQKNEGFGSRYFISNEREELLETGGGLLKAKEYLEKADHILMMNVDILSNINLKNFIQYHLIHHPLATLAIQDRKNVRKLLFYKNQNEEYQLKGWKNTESGFIILNENEIKDDVQQFAFSGIQIFSSEIFKFIKQQGKFSILETYLDLMNEHSVLGYDHTGDILMDVGKPESIIEAEKLFS